MRKTLHPLMHQLSLVLALPLAVSAVWIVRGNPAGVRVTQTAIAYRADLAELPLPTRLRLRAPHEPSAWLGVQRQPEDPIARRRRAPLPVLVAPQPVELAKDAGSESDRSVAPSPRSGQPEPPAAPLAWALVPREALPIVTTPPPVTSRSAVVSARIDAPDGDTDAATEASERDPAAEAAADVSTAPEKTAVARTEAEYPPPAKATPSLKLAPESGVPIRIPVTPSQQTPAPPARSLAVLDVERPDPASAAKPAPMRVASLPVPAKAPGWISPGPAPAGANAPSHAAPASSGAASNRSGGPVPERKPDADARATSKGGASWTPPEPNWRQDFAAALPTPALANATRFGNEPLELSFDHGDAVDSLLGSLLPVHSSRNWAVPGLAGADPIAVTPSSFDAMTLHTLPELARVSPEVFAGATSAENEAMSPAIHSNPRLFPPSIYTRLAIPEPGSALLLGVALAALAEPRRRRRRG